MISDVQRSKIIQFAKKQVAENDPYHGMDHLKETARLALGLSKTEGGDPEVCWVSAMLHDIHKGRAGDHGTEGAKEAKKFLLDIGMNGDFAEKVRDAIHYHNKGFSDGSVERQILWDADKLQLMNLEGFKKRMVPFWVYRLGKKEGIEKSIYEYYFYKKRFHTKTAKNEAEKDAVQMEEYFRVLRGGR
jgi:putative nucleotidyltransferase with HDIG domain